jgi:hypothetical protein
LKIEKREREIEVEEESEKNKKKKTHIAKPHRKGTLRGGWAEI